MAVAGALAQLRTSVPTNPKPPPSILHPSRDAAKVPLAEQAALAYNSLSLLSSIDDNLPTLAEALLLTNPTTRQTLDLHAQQSLSSASIEIAHRLSPIFPLRHAQRVYEWVVNGLHAGLLAPDEEIDALLFASLPFHTSPQFPAFVAAVVLPFPRKRWKWLTPVAQMGKPASLSFLIKNCPFSVHRRVIPWVLQLTKLAVPVTHASSFLVNVTARWILDASPDRRRAIVLACVRALSTIHKSQRGNLSNLFCALMTVMSAAVIAGIEEDVATILIQAAISVIVWSQNKLAHASAALLALLLHRSDTSCVPVESALLLIREKKAALIQQLGDQAPRVYWELLQCTLVEDLPDVPRMLIIKEALLGDGSVLLCEEFVTRAVSMLLDINAPTVTSSELTGSEMRTNDHRDALVDILKPLCRGRYANAADVGLRKHFNGRANDRGRYDFVDKVLSSALHGTSFTMIKASDTQTAISDTTLLAAFDHPEPSVRENALQRLFQSDGIAVDLGACSEVGSKVLAMLTVEEDIAVLSRLFSYLVKLSASLDTRSVLLAAGRRLLCLPHAPSPVQAKHLGLIWGQWVLTCETSVRSFAPMIFAFLTGFILLSSSSDGDELNFLTEPSLLRNLLFKALKAMLKVSGEEFKMKSLSIGGDLKWDSLFGIRKLLSDNSRFDTGSFFGSLAEWDSTWPLKMMEVLIQGVADDASTELSPESVETFMVYFRQVSPSSDVGALCSALSLACKVLCTTSISTEQRQECALSLWRVSALTRRNDVTKTVVDSLVQAVGLDEVLNILKNGCSRKEERNVQACSIRWFMSIMAVVSRNTGRHVQDGLPVILNAYYGFDAVLLREVQQFCDRFVKKVPSVMKATSPIIRLAGVLCRLPMTRSDTKMSIENDAMRKYVTFRQLVLRHVEASATPCPLFMSSSDQEVTRALLDDVVSILFSTHDLEQQLCLLRAVEGHFVTDVRTLAQCHGLLSSVLNSMSDKGSIADCNLHAELISRVVMLLEQGDRVMVPKQRASRIIKHVMANLSMFCDFNDSVRPGMDRLRLSLLSCCTYLMDVTDNNSNVLMSSLVRLLFIFSSKSSVIGIFAKHWIDAAFGVSLSMDDLRDSLFSLGNVLSNQSKKPKVKNSEEDFLSKLVPLERIGALETVARWAATPNIACKLKAASVAPLKRLVWKFLRDTSQHLSDSKCCLEEDIEYVLQLSLDALVSLYRLCPSEEGSDEMEVEVEVLMPCLFYPGKGVPLDRETAAGKRIRKSTLELVDVLAPVHAADVRNVADQVIFSLLQRNDSSTASESLQALVTCLLKAGCDFKAISEWLCEGAYGPTTAKDEQARLRIMVSSCCAFAPDRKKAVLLCLEGLISRQRYVLSDDQLGEQCSLFLSDSGLPLSTELEIISESPEHVRCQLALSHVLHSSLVMRLFEFKNETDDGAVNSAAVVNNVVSQYASMILSLAACEDEALREEAMGATVAVLPLPGLSVYLKHALAYQDHIIRARAVSSFARRMEDMEAPLFPVWNLDQSVELSNDEDSNEAQVSLIHEAGGYLCKQLDKIKPIANVTERGLVEEMHSLITAVDAVVRRFGSASETATLNIADCVIGIVDKSMEVLKCGRSDVEDQRTTLSAGLRCLESVISTLGQNAVSVIPRALDGAVTLVEWGFRGPNVKEQTETRRWVKSMVPVTEAAVRLCTSVLHCAPILFGEESLFRLAVLVVSSRPRVVEDVVNMAMEQMPHSSVVGAICGISQQLEKLEANGAGIRSLVNCLENGVKSMRKSEVKVEAKRILEVCTRCLEHRRDIVVTAMDTNTVEHNIVDGACGELLTTLTLRLPESDFKKVFDKLVQWCAEGALPEMVKTTLAKEQVTLEKSLIRAIPMYRIIVKLFEKLQAIMVPYYLQLIDQVLRVISCKATSVSSSGEPVDGGHSGKKRKRTTVDTDGERAMCSQYVAKQATLQDICLQGLSVLLKQKSSSGSLSDNVVANMEEALFSCFDDRFGKCSRVTDALCALAVRISTMQSATDESKEHSRQLLMALSRQVLTRTREGHVELREGALLTSEAMALAVGDEYLVTLPESMPVLSEVIDDEDDGVQKAAKSFVSVMESLAGEPLLNQLK